MELIKKDLLTRAKIVADKISRHNLFLLSSSVSYYSALALAPFVLILLGVASLLGRNIQDQIVQQTNVTFSPQVGSMVQMIFENVNERVNVGSLSGVIGLVVLLWTASLVFLQLRYSLDVIHGYYNPHLSRSTWSIIKERLFSMAVVIGAAVLFIVSMSLTTIFQHVFRVHEMNGFWPDVMVFYLNFIIYLVMFIGIHYLTPSKRPDTLDCLKIATLSAVFFQLGNMVLAVYLKRVAASSVYGAAGSLLVFLTWSYYSSFTLFLSAEVFLYLKRIGKIQ